MRFTILFSIITAFFCLTCPVDANPIQVVDGDFNAWSFGSLVDPSASVSVTRETTGGNPGARLNATTNTPLGLFATGLAIKDDFSIGWSFEGKDALLKLDVLSGPGASGQGQSIGLLVEQGNALYWRGLGDTGLHANFETLTFNTTLEASSFVHISATGPSNPTFSNAFPTKFGFSFTNSGSLAHTQFYDNFDLILLPEPSTALITLTLIGITLLRCPARKSFVLT